MSKLEKPVFPNTWLNINPKYDITCEFNDTIPYPIKIDWLECRDTKQLIPTYKWLIKGTFGTPHGKDYIEDIIHRIHLTMDCKEVWFYYEKPTEETKSLHKKAIDLKYFNNLKSRVFERKKDYSRTESMFDETFWNLKLYAEDLIKDDGYIIYNTLYDYGIDKFKNHSKGLSTVKAKIRSIYKWYEKRNWQIGREKRKYENKKDLIMSKSKHMTNINLERKRINAKKIDDLINGLFKDDYIKPSKKYNINKIAKDTQLNRKTVSTHLKSLKTTI
jgi:hypothetical protein